MPIFKPRPNGNMIVDEIIEDVAVDGLRAFNVEKCPNVYSNALDEAIYEGLSLRDIFEDGNLVVNGDFSIDSNSDGLADNWDVISVTTYSLTDDIQTLNATSRLGRIQQLYYIVDNYQYYLYSKLKVLSTNSVGLTFLNNGGGFIYVSSSTDFQIISGIRTVTGTGNTYIGVIDYRTSGWTQIDVDFVGVLNLSTLFTTAPSQTQLDEWLSLYLYLKNSEGTFTGSAVVGGLYIDYDNDIAHNLTTIYGAGNEPTLSEHEALIPQYTNVVLKAKAFENDLQQEYMAVSLDSVVYEGLSLRDIFENDTDGITLPNGTKTFEISGNNLVQRVKKYTLQSSDVRSLITNTTNIDRVEIGKNSYDNIFIDADRTNWTYNTVNTANNVYYSGYTQKVYSDSLDNINTLYGSLNYFIVLSFSKGTYATLAEAQADLAGTVLYYQLATPIVLHTFTTAPTQTQLDEWLDMYLTLTASNTNTGTDFVQDRFYIDYDNEVVYDYNIIEPYLPTTLDTVVYEGKSYRDIFENDTEGITLPNGTKTFEISGNDLVQRVKKYTLQENDVFNISNRTYAQRIKIYLPSDAFDNHFNNNIENDIFYISYYESAYSQVEQGFYIPSFTTYLDEVWLYNELGTYSTLAEAKADLAGTVIYYQLATPIVLHTFTTAPTQTQLDTWLQTYLYLTDREQVMADILDKTVTLTSIPVKAKIYKDRFVILGNYVIVGE